ncbi:MAG: transglutaminase domain-containing protein [Candidatus Kariarchaeaceae archaeon]|jgi:hypothetical protein
MRNIVAIIIFLLLASSIFVMRDAIFPSDESKDNDENGDIVFDPCNDTRSFEERLKIVEESPNLLPSPEEEVAYIEALDGKGFNYDKDRYLYRWRVAETYNTSFYDFDQKYTNYRIPYIDYQDFIAGNTDSQRHFKISEQYLTLSDSYCGDALVPWNSELGGLIGPTNNVNASISNIGTMIPNSANGYRDINEQPVLSTKFNTTLTHGFLEYESFWVEEDKENISKNSIKMAQLDSVLDGTSSNNFPTNRFGNLSSVNPDEIDGIWGLESLPGGLGYLDRMNPESAGFVTKHDSYKSVLDLNPDISVYDFVLLIYNEIQNAVLQGLYDGSLNIDPTQTSGVADMGSDKAFWFYQSIEDPTMQFGMKELLAGFTNMLRSFGIPARPVIGFSVGEFFDDGGTPGISTSARGDDIRCYSDDCDYIEILFEHIHVWTEVLIPVESDGLTNYHWGIFNPIPDPWILQNDDDDLEYGRNALGTGLEIELEITSGNTTLLANPIEFDPILSTDTLYLNEMGRDLTGRVKVSYDGIPSSGQTVELKLLTETELLSGDFDPDVGISLQSMATDGSDGWGRFKIFVDTNGQVFTYDENDIRNTTAISGLNITEWKPLESLGNIGFYGIVAVYGNSINVSLIGWELDTQIKLTANATLISMINPNTGGIINSYNVTIGSTLQFQVEVTDSKIIPNPLQGITTIDFLLLNENDYNTLLTSLSQNILDTNLIQINKLGTFSATDPNGQATLNITFDQAFIDFYEKPLNEVYATVALIQTGFKFNLEPVFLWFEMT